MPTLTKKQKQIYDYIKKYVQKKIYSPTFEEIKGHFGYSTLSTVHEHIDTLIKKGLISKNRYNARGIELRKYDPMIQIPLLGTIAAGEPIGVVEEKEIISVPKSKLPSNSNIYALRVIGDSMIDENINNGDTVLIKNQSTASNGQKVVALIDSECATLKKFYREKNYIRLQPANKTLEPIIIKRNRGFIIQGIVIDVIKNENHLEALQKSKPAKPIEQYKELPINKIVCNDAVEELQKLPDNSVELILTDPPYGISRELNCKNQRLGTTARLNFNFGEWDAFNKEWFDIAVKKTRGWIISFCAKKDLGFYWNILEKNNFKAIDAIVWQKPDPIPLNGKTKMLNAWETAIIGKKAGASFNGKCQHNIFKYQAPKGKNRIHPTQKPTNLMRELILLTTKNGDTVLDPFMGSGTTAIACIETKRNYIGFEINKKYHKQSLERIKNAQTPLL